MEWNELEQLPRAVPGCSVFTWFRRYLNQSRFPFLTACLSRIQWTLYNGATGLILHKRGKTGGEFGMTADAQFFSKKSNIGSKQDKL